MPATSLRSMPYDTGTETATPCPVLTFSVLCPVLRYAEPESDMGPITAFSGPIWDAGGPAVHDHLGGHVRLHAGAQRRQR
eukprot:1224180-Rhodomonas_salina.1